MWRGGTKLREVHLGTVRSTCALDVVLPEYFLKSFEESKVKRTASAGHQSFTSTRFVTKLKKSVAGNRFQEIFTMERPGDESVAEASCFVPLFTQRTDAGSFQKTEELKESNLQDLTAVVTNPTGIKQKGKIFENGENSYSVRFVPKVLGVHIVSVMYKNVNVPGSPYQFNVGPNQDGGAGKVTVCGPGLESAEVSIPAEFSISTKEAGAGGLSISVEGPSKAEIDFDDKGDGKCAVSYITTEPGDYQVSVKFSDDHIPGSPFPVRATGVGIGPSPSRVQILRGASDPSKVTTSGDGLTQGAVGEENTFLVDCSQAGSNMLMVGVHGPSAPCEEVFVRHIGNRRYTVTYIAREPGQYSLLVKWGEVDIPGSPFTVTVS